MLPRLGQTYPRKADSRILNCLSAIAQSCYRMANDIRLLQHDRQVEEPFEKNQIGSSAMAYKRNPMRSERICSLARYLMADAMNAPMTASVQWLERTLDDSANRRISMPEGFLCADAILRLAQNVTDGLHVNEKIVDRTCREYLPFIATENLMMEGVKRGGEVIARRISEYFFKSQGAKVPCGGIDIGMTRDDLVSEYFVPDAVKNQLGFDITDKKVVLCDDILHTGRSAVAAIEAIFQLGRPRRIQLLVLIDRGGREVPVRADYVGRNVPTSRTEYVNVFLKELGAEEDSLSISKEKLC